MGACERLLLRFPTGVLGLELAMGVERLFARQLREARLATGWFVHACSSGTEAGRAEVRSVWRTGWVASVRVLAWFLRRPPDGFQLGQRSSGPLRPSFSSLSRRPVLSMREEVHPSCGSDSRSRLSPKRNSGPSTRLTTARKLPARFRAC